MPWKGLGDFVFMSIASHLVLSTLHTRGAPLQTNGQAGMRTMESSVNDRLDRSIIGEGDWQAFQAEQAASSAAAGVAQPGLPRF